MHSDETTNGQIERAIAALQILIQWAEADAYHAAESDAPSTASADRARAKLLRKALDLVEKCRR